MGSSGKAVVIHTLFTVFMLTQPLVVFKIFPFVIQL